MSYEFSLHPHRLHELIVQTMHALREHRLYVVANRILLFLDSVKQYLGLLQSFLNKQFLSKHGKSEQNNLLSF